MRDCGWWWRCGGEEGEEGDEGEEGEEGQEGKRAGGGGRAVARSSGVPATSLVKIRVRVKVEW